MQQRSNINKYFFSILTPRFFILLLRLHASLVFMVTTLYIQYQLPRARYIVTPDDITASQGLSSIIINLTGITYQITTLAPWTGTAIGKTGYLAPKTVQTTPCTPSGGGTATIPKLGTKTATLTL